jgi:hypothetical protein
VTSLGPLWALIYLHRGTVTIVGPLWAVRNLQSTSMIVGERLTPHFDRGADIAVGEQDGQPVGAGFLNLARQLNLLRCPRVGVALFHGAGPIGLERLQIEEPA